MALQFNQYGKPIVKRSLNFTEVDSEKNSGISMAVPDLSYSVQDLVKNFSVGNLPSDVVRRVLYSDNPDFDDFVASELGDFDLVDAHREINKLRELHKMRLERQKASQIENPPQESAKADTE